MPLVYLLLAVIAVGVRAAAIARIDRTRRRHVEGARKVVPRPLAVELARTEVDVRGAVTVDPRLRLKAVGSGVAGVEGHGFEQRKHSCVSTPPS